MNQTLTQRERREKRHDSLRLVDPLFAAPDALVEELIARARAAQHLIEGWTEAQIDQLLLALAQMIADHAEDLAVATIRETGMGNLRDKSFKNRIASLGIYERLAGQIGRGVIDFDSQRQIAEVASPVGIVVGLAPATHPVATFIFKALIAIKGRNALILSPSRRAQQVSNQVGALIQQGLRQAGAPADLVQWVQSGGRRETTAALMSHPQVGLILATGGAAMVKAAYRSPTPTIGVGPGNAPVLIDADADVAHAARGIVESKAFDNGLICGAENSLVAVTDIRAGLVAELERHGAAVLSSAEAARLLSAAVDSQSHRFKPRVIGQSAATLAAWAHIQRPFAIQLLVVPTASVAAENYLAAEKLAPVVGLFTVADADQGLRICRALLEIEGAGHTAIIHTQDTDLIARFAAELPASRILVNSPGTQGVLGLTTGLALSMTLGCGTWGGASTTDSITYRHLLNIKRIAYSTSKRAEMDANEHPADIQPLTHYLNK
jgi:acetaldehyde dehydrogenase/alcohol dehydrogenase